VVAGLIADRLGRTWTTSVAMGLSGASAIVCGLLFGAAPLIVLSVCLVWGVTIVADSAQFSTAVSELSPPGTAGSALSLQLAAGFILTGVTILGIGLLAPVDGSGWRVAWVLLALGPAVGIAAMWRLRGRPDATKMASGHR
jgi:MFS family permease